MSSNFNSLIDDDLEISPALSTTEYIATRGITNNRLGIRLRTGDAIPVELTADTSSFDWLLRKGAIELRDIGG